MAISPLQYTIDFVIHFVSPKNALKTLVAVNKPLAVTQSLLKAFSQTFVGLAYEMEGLVKPTLAFGDALFVLGLIQKGLTLAFGQTFLVLDRMSGELATFRARVLAAFNPAVAVQNIDTLRVSLTSIVQTLHDTGSTWESVTELVVDSATKMKVASGIYAQVATAAGQYSTTEEQLKAVSDATISVARATGVATTQYGQLAATLGSTVASTKLSNTAIKEYGDALTALTSTLPITVEYQNKFVDANALLISSGRLSVNQVLAYGAVFEEAGVAVADSVRSFSKLTQTLLAPAAATTEAQLGLEQLGYTVEDIAKLMEQPGGLNTALTELLTRIQGISNTDPAAALAALQSIVGTSSSGQPTAQNIEQLASSLGLLQQNLSMASDSAGNAQLSDELQKIALEADPTLRLNQAFANLADTWGTVLRPAVITIANALADVVDWISGLVTGVRNVLQAVLAPLSIFYKLLTTILPLLTTVSTALLALNASIIAVRVSAYALNKAGLALMAANIRSTTLAATGLDLVLVNLSYKLQGLYDILVNKVRPGFTGIASDIKVSPWKQLTSTIANLGKLLVRFAPQILLVGLAFLAVRSAVLTYIATMKQANKTKELIKGINKSAEELGKSFEVVEEKSDGVFSKIANVANNAMEAIRDNLSIFEHIGKAIGNEQLAAFKFATQAEASAVQAEIAYGNLLTTVDKYGESYNKVVASLKATPTDPAALKSGKDLIALLQKQKEALEKVEVTKEQAASRDVYVKSLDDQIRYVTKLTVGNDALANSIDQAAVSVEDMEQALSNLRNKVGEELTKQVEKEIDTLKEQAEKVEETEKAKVDAAEDTAKKQFDAQEKQISRSQQLEDRSIERSRAKEDRAIEAAQDAADRALEQRQAAEDKALQKQFDAKEAAIEKQQAAEDKAIEKQQAAEDRAIEQRQAAEDKAIARSEAAEDAALQKQYEAEDAALQRQLDRELAAIEQVATAKEAALNRELELKEVALQQQLDNDLASIDLGLKAREDALAKELAAREAAINEQTEARVNTLEAQQAKALQAAEATFNAQQRAIDSAFELRKQQTEQAHKNKLIQQETAAKARLQQLEEQFNTRQIEKQLAAVEQRKAKELASVNSREDAALKAFDRQQQLQNADSPEDRAKLQAEFELADKIEAQRQAIRDKYEAERQAKEQAAEKEKAALEAEKAKKEQELAAAKKKEEEVAAAEQARLEAEKQAALDKLELEKEAAKAERQAAYDKQQEEIKLAFEAKLNEARTLAEQQLQELRVANEQLLEDARNEAERQRNNLRLEHEKLVEQLRLETENKINELKLEAEKQAELLRLKAEEEKEKRELAREQAKEQRELKREEEAEQRKLQREEAAEKLKEQRELQAEQRAIKREADKEARAERFEAAKEQREQQREAAKEAREKQREEQAYQRQIKREDEDYARQIKREEEAVARQEAFEAAEQEREKQYEAEKAAREKALAEQVANREAELAKELEVIKLQTQESIEQSYAEIVAGLKASADAIAAAAAAANKSAGSGASPSKRFKGGVVKTGLPYWVGEDRRTGRLTSNSELFIPSTDGYIANAAQVWGMIKAAQSISRYNRAVPSNYNARPKRKQEQQLVSDVNVIKQQVNKLARAVNDRTNTLSTTQRNPIKPIIYYDLSTQ